MTAWEFLNSTVGGAIVLGAILGLFGWLGTRSTHALLRRQGEILEHMDASTKALLGRMETGLRETLERMDAGTKALLAQMEANAGARHGAVMDKLEGRA
jgi:hypothetical protein